MLRKTIRKFKPRLSDTERYKRFVAMGEEVGASIDPKAFERVFKTVTKAQSAKPAKRPM